MGYYSTHAFTITEVDESTVDQIRRELGEVTCGDPDGFESTGRNSFRSEHAKWYHLSEAMRDIANKYPEAFIEIESEGEDAAHWIEYYQGSRYESHDAEIRFPEASWLLDYDDEDEE